MTLTSEELQCGPGGCAGKPLYKQCWTKTTQASYKACIGFGVVSGGVQASVPVGSISRGRQESPDIGSKISNVAFNFGDDCGYAVLGRDEQGGDYTFSYVQDHTDLGNKLIKVSGDGKYAGELAAIKAVKSSLSNTPDGCICPLDFFKYDGGQGLFYTWDTDIKESIEKMNEINSGVKLNPNFACLLSSFKALDYKISFYTGCGASSVPTGDDKAVAAIKANDFGNTYKTTPLAVSDVCPESSKKRWKCRSLLKVDRTLYLDPSKTLQDNTDLMVYIKQYGKQDYEYVKRGLQYYGKNVESEEIVMFCVPSD